MIRFQDLKEGDIVMAEYEGQRWEGVVKDLNRVEKEVCVQTEVQEFWFTPMHLYPLPLSEEQLIKLGFQKMDTDTGVKYMKGSFRLQLAGKDDFSDMEIWWREDRRHLKKPINVHELQNHYYEMTKVELNAE